MIAIEQKTIPWGWQKLHLGDVAEITNGKTNSQDAVVGGKYPLFDRSVLIKKSDKFLFDREAVILPGEGAEFIPRYFKGKFDLHQRAYAIFAREEKIFSPFLFQFLFANRNVFAQTAVGSTVKSLRLPIIQKVFVNIPSLPEQKKIAEILFAVDKEIEKNNEIIFQTEKLKKGLMQNFFGKKLNDKNKKLKDITKNIQYGHTASAKKEDTGLKFLRITDISNGNVNWDKVPFCEINTQVKNYKLQCDDIVFARTGATTGRSFYIENPPNSIFASYLIRLQVNNNIDAKFLYYFFQSDNYWKQINAGISGSAQGGFNATKLGNLNIPLENLEGQKKIAEILSSVDDKIIINKNLKNKLVQLKKGLMGDLLSGKVRVKN